MWIECEFSRLREVEEQQRQQAKPKNTPMDVKRQEEFLKDQGKVKKAEQIWFDKLEEELDKIEMDEQLRRLEDESNR